METTWVAKYAAMGIGWSIWQSLRKAGEQNELRSFQLAFQDVDMDYLTSYPYDQAAELGPNGYLMIHNLGVQSTDVRAWVTNIHDVLNTNQVIACKKVIDKITKTNPEFYNDTALSRSEPCVIFYNEINGVSFYCLLSEFVLILKALVE